jgi:hypothetical protein
MTHHRVALAVIGMSMFVVCGQWPGLAQAQVNFDIGGVHIQVGDRRPAHTEVVEVLTRGPVHEAFAQPVIFDNDDAFIITRRPPPPLDEIVPDDRPDGNHIVWIPGYWSWDSDRGDFIWVSGCWRAIPPNNSWVPGYWAPCRGGYQWIEGFWTAADTDEIEYLPRPPATLEDGPPGEGSPDNIWVPGCWVRYHGRYAWRAGYWEQARTNWVWEPAQYISTPRGYVYVEGYWDYPLERRGVAFLPVYCPQSLYSRPDYRYSPDYVLDLDGLTMNLFISPQRHQYYFGDYYGAEYSRAGYRPWYEVRDHHDWYDPIFVHQQWQHRDDHQWYENERSGYDRRRDDQALRPARTYEGMKTQEARLPEKDRRQVQLARPMKEVAADNASPYKFSPMDAKTRESTASQAKEVHAYKDKRSQWETPTATPRDVVSPKEADRSVPKDSSRQPADDAKPAERAQANDRGDAAREQSARQDAQPERVKVDRSPVADRHQVRDKDQTPPPRTEQPKPDPEARPKASKADDSDRSKDGDRSEKDKNNSENDSRRD